MSTSGKLRAVAVLAASTLLFACDLLEPETVRIRITSDRAVYSAAVDTAATPILANIGRDTVYVVMGEYVYAERRFGGKWYHANSWFVVDGTGPSFPVAPGDTLRASAMRFSYVGKEPGTYRFVFVVAYDRDMRRLLPKEMRVSKPFQLKP